MFKVAALQMRVHLGNPQINRQRAFRLAEQAADSGARLLVMPELWVTGYELSARAFAEMAETRNGETVTIFRRLARERRLVIVVPFVEKENELKDNGLLYNSAAVINDDGNIAGIYRKSYLWGKEKEIFTAGEKNYPVFSTSVGNIGVLICYDMEFPEPSRQLALSGAELIVVPSVWSRNAERRWDIQLPARALDNTVFVLGVNAAGINTCGKSKLAAPDGRVLAEAPRDDECLLIHDVDLSQISWTRQYIPYLRDLKR
ncbi:carbon-nitrogen hydrolase [Bacillaceae bacterium]